MPLDRVLPTLLERALARGWRCVVETGRADRLAALDELLWTYGRTSFLPHARKGQGEGAPHPVWLTDGDDTPNGAVARIFLDGADVAARVDGLPAHERLILVFDGDDDAALADARRQWKALKAMGTHALSYWQPDEEGRWSQKG